MSHNLRNLRLQSLRRAQKRMAGSAARGDVEAPRNEDRRGLYNSLVRQFELAEVRYADANANGISKSHSKKVASHL